MNVKTHINFLLNEYKLKTLRRKYIMSATLTSFIRESFYWTLIYFSIKLESKEEIKKVAIFLMSILLINIPLERKSNDYRIDLINKLKNANNTYFSNKLKNTAKKDLLKIDLVNYYNNVYSINGHIYEYIINKKTFTDIPITFISVLVIILSKDLGKNSNKAKIILTILLIIYMLLIVYLNEQEIKKEITVMEESLEYDNKTRDYIVNSKLFLMNNTFNEKYIKENGDKFNFLVGKMEKMDNNLSTQTNLSMFVVFAIIISYVIGQITPSNIIRYFLIIYDIDMITKKMREFYKNKMSYDKMGVKLNLLNNLLNDDNLNIKKSTDKIDKIIIKEINNKEPKLELKKPITLYKGDMVLLDGISGSGKTTLMYLLKGIKKIDKVIIEPELDKIYSRCYITLPNERDIFSANLYDIISNFDKNPEIELIKSALTIVQLNKYLEKIKENTFVNIENISAGEMTRFMIARLIYQIKINKNYDILLFDEIDTNLNINLSIEICNTLKNIFKDKIILYITHNDDVKNMFDKRIKFTKGVIEYQN